MTRATRAIAAAVLTAAVVAAGCGGGGGGGGLDESLRYFPADSSIVTVISTDLEGSQFKELDGIVEERVHRHIESFLRAGAQAVGFSWEEDVKPLLGHELVVGSPTVPGVGGGGVVAVLHTPDGGKLRSRIEDAERFEKTGKASGVQLYRDSRTGQELAIDGDELVTASGDATLRDSLALAKGKDHLDEKTFRSRLGDLPTDAFVQTYGDATAFLGIPRVTPLRQIPWFDALRTFGAAISFRSHRALLDFRVNTDPKGLSDADLPLATGAEAPQVLRRNGQIVGANRNQSLTTAFLYRLAETALPNSRFVRDVHRAQSRLGIDFVSEVLRQFDGPSASSVSLDGKTYAARSAVSDPARLERLLPRLAPHLPRLVVGLQGLQSEGEALLFIFAPDALTAQGTGVTVTRVGDLWRVRGLTGEGPNQLYFGVLGKVFVVASDPGLAHRVATEPTVAAPGARGAAVSAVDLSGARAELAARLGFDPGRIGKIVVWLDASRQRLRGQVSVELP
ncbi:MAG TPA: hypothetical protein VE596_05600 [Gaiellaceae bacterium]|nr:hypothetical protein [Gaiellaceae bacterium]